MIVSFHTSTFCLNPPAIYSHLLPFDIEKPRRSCSEGVIRAKVSLGYSQMIETEQLGSAIALGVSSLGLSFLGVLLNGVRTLNEVVRLDYDYGGGSGSGKGRIGNYGDGGKHSSYDHVSIGQENEDDDTPVVVIIPALNEEACISQTLENLAQLDPPAHRIVVVDGGSRDQTVDVSRENGAFVLDCLKRGRAIQLNHGAWSALEEMNGRKGIFCFLHADTTVPLDLVKLVRSALDERTICVGFVPIIAIPSGIMWGMSLHNTVKTWYAPPILNPLDAIRGFRCIFGDQAICCTTEDFAAVGGFDESLPIMEDADFCQRLHRRGGWRRGRVRMLNRGVVTSGRRLAKLGPWRSTFVHVVIGFNYAIGASPQRLKELYDSLYKDIR